MSTSFEPTAEVPLYGGAVLAQLPKDFFDASSVRPVEDHQEVYLKDDGGSQSLIFDILELAPGSTDQEILDAHLADILLEDEIRLRETYPLRKRVLTFKRRNGDIVEADCLTQSLITIPSPETSRSSPNVFTYSVIRLTKEATDIVITANYPLNHGDIDESVDFNSAHLRELVAVTRRRLIVVLESLKIEDWLLFG